MLYDYFTNIPVKIDMSGRCIIVGNSGNVSKFRKGNIINNFDIVVRLNNAPTNKYENIVGNKTDIRICAHNTINKLTDNLLKDIKILIVWGIKNHLNNNFDKLKQIRIKYPYLPIYKLTDDYMNYNYRLFNKYTGIIKNNTIWLSTGWFSIFLGLMLSKDVNLYGFGFLDKSNCKYHYYDNLNGDQSSHYNSMLYEIGHKFYIESNVFINLINKGVLKYI